MAKNNLAYKIDMLEQLTYLAMANTPAFCQFQTVDVRSWLLQCIDVSLGDMWSPQPPNEGVNWAVPLGISTVHLHFPDRRRDGESTISEQVRRHDNFLAKWYESIHVGLMAGYNNPRVMAMLAHFDLTLREVSPRYAKYVGKQHSIAPVMLISEADLRVIHRNALAPLRLVNETTQEWSEIRTGQEYEVSFYSPAGSETVVLMPVKLGVDGRECWYITDTNPSRTVLGHLLVEYGVPLIPALVDSNRQFSAQSRSSRIMRAVERILEKESLDA